ncbi:glutamyl-tRNA reductase [Candidatus Laterigemmans baculatus]|uniref:glutamyl-tRNA reductase n=1 Tax=Candidatus Laterigemmans baculatus TaxID=2770505 RepID=UPI0013DAA86A|nr:glutamyl-tRNA reductase [Candidatus Laterigemmans baculatus]
MKLQMIGCSHKDAAVEFREQLSFTESQAVEALEEFRQRFPSAEIVLLSTCNRVELYTAAVEEDACPEYAEVVGFLAAQRKLPPDQLLERLNHRSGAEAVEHLFTVAAALDSMVVGEAQILSQVKQAYERATATGSTGALTHAIFQTASRVAKRVQAETAIHRRRVSVPSVAVGEVAPEFFETLADKRILLVGAGEMGAETLRYLRDGGARDITVINRSAERATRLAADLAAQTAPWESLDEHLAAADLVVSTTGSTEPIVTLERFRAIQAARYERLLLVLDLAVPRDFDPAIGDLSNVYLFSVDDLQASCDRNRREREREWPKARAIIAEETEQFLASLQQRAAGPVIRQLRERAEAVKREELDRLLKRLERLEMVAPQVSSDAGRAEITQAFDRVVNKLLHPPLASLRDDAADGHRQGLLDALRRLFQLGD